MATAFPTSFLAPSRAGLLHRAGGGRRVLVLDGARGAAAAAAGRPLVLVPATALVAAAARRARCSGGGRDLQPYDVHEVAYDATAKVCVGVVVVLRGDDKLLEDLAAVAKESQSLVDKMIKDDRVYESQGDERLLDDRVFKEMRLAQTAFQEVEREAGLGYVSSSTVEAAFRGLKTMLLVFAGNATVGDVMGPDPTSIKEANAAYMKQLAEAYTDLLLVGKKAYAHVALPEGANTNAVANSDTNDEEVSYDATAKVCVGVVVVLRGDEKLLEDLAAVAKDSQVLLQKVLKDDLANESQGDERLLDDRVFKEMRLAQTAFQEVEREAGLGYVFSSTVEAASRGLKTILLVFAGKAGEEVVGPDPTSIHEDNAAYMKQLAEAYTDLLLVGKKAYAQVELPEGAADTNAVDSDNNAEPEAGDADGKDRLPVEDGQ